MIATVDNKELMYDMGSSIFEEFQYDTLVFENDFETTYSDLEDNATKILVLEEFKRQFDKASEGELKRLKEED